jgi:pimeloyl-ACP methyl ester carboxylesterase
VKPTFDNPATITTIEIIRSKPGSTNKRTLYALLVAVQLLFVTSIANAQPYQIINTQNSVVGGNLNRTVTAVQEGNNPLNRFFMSKVVKPVPAQALKGAILLLPPLGSGFQNYEVGKNGDYNKSFVGYFAQRDFLVVGYSPRVQDLAAGSCESGAIDCSPMADWGLQTIVDDVAFIREQIEIEFPGIKTIIGGLSMGSIASLATLNVHPNDYAGAILIEGTIHDLNADVRAINTNFCSTFEAQLAGGVYFDGQSGPGIKLLNQLAQTAPNESVFPGFPPGLTNHQAFVLALSAPPVSPLSPRPGYFNLAGSVAEDRFFFANESLVHANIATFVDYTTTRSLRDLTCGLAGETTFTNNLDDFTGPAIMFVAGHGFGSAMFDTAQLMTSADATIHFNPQYGHVDFSFSTKHVKELEHRILNWLKHEVVKD